jgi:hypothetical protein
MRPFALASLLAGLLAVAVPAQARKPLLGTVVDGKGTPIAGAVVECVLAPDGPDLPPLDVLTATTDARGRFRVDALPCGSYRCWAAAPKDADGAQFVSDVVATAVGQLAALVAKTKGGAGAIALRGLDAWQDRAPFTLRCVVAGRAVDLAIEAVDGAFTVQAPVRPLGGVEAQVRDRDGFHVHFGMLTPRATRLSVSAPQTVRCRVVDEAGQPVPGARISTMRQGGPFRRIDPRNGLFETPPAQVDAIGVTGDDGVALVRVPAAWSLFDEKKNGDVAGICFRADAPGRRASHAGRGWQGFFEDGKAAAERKDRDGFTFTLHPAVPQRFRLVDGDAPLAGIAVSLTYEITTKTGDGFVQSWNDVVRATTDADGWFDVVGMPEDQGQARMQFAVGGRDAAAAGGAPFAVRPIVLHPQSANAAGNGARRIDVGAFATVVLAVRDTDGGPGRGVQIALVSASPSRRSFDFEDLSLLAPDAAGRVAVRLEPGAWCAIACTKEGLVVKEFDAATTPTLELAVAPLPTMRARVVDADGKPVAGARFAVGQTMWEGGQTKATDWLLQRLGQSWNNRLLDGARSGDDGEFRAGIVPTKGWSVRGVFRVRGKKSEEFEISVGDVGDVVVK